MRRPHFLLLAFLILALAAATPAAPAATLHVAPPAQVGADGVDPVLAALPGGGWAFAWAGSAAAPGVYAVRRDAAGALGDVERVFDRPAMEVQLAAGPSGELALAWIEGTPGGSERRRLRAALAEAGAPFEAPLELAGGAADQPLRPRVAVAADGAVAVGFKLHRPNAFEAGLVALRPRGERFAPAQELWPWVVNGPDLGVDAAGGIVAMWSGSAAREGWSGAQVVQVAGRAPGASAFGAPTTLSSASRNADNNFAPPQLAVGPRGDAVVAWSPMPIATGPVFPSSTAAAFRPAGGNWTTTEDLPGEGARAHVAVNGRGDAIVVNQLGPGIGAHFRRSGGAFVAEWMVPLSRGVHMHTPVALDDAGNAVAVDAATPPAPVPGVVALIRPARGCFGEEVDVSPRGVVVGRPVLSLRGDGTGVVAWAADEGGRWTVRSADLRVAPGGRETCPETDRPRPGVTLPVTKLSVAKTPARVGRRALWRDGIRFRVRAPRGSATGASLVPAGRPLERLAKVNGRVGPRGVRTLRIRMPRATARALPRDAKLELWIYATAPGHTVAGKIRRLAVR